MEVQDLENWLRLCGNEFNKAHAAERSMLQREKGQCQSLVDNLRKGLAEQERAKQEMIMDMVKETKESSQLAVDRAKEASKKSQLAVEATKKLINNLSGHRSRED